MHRIQAVMTTLGVVVAVLAISGTAGASTTADPRQPVWTPTCIQPCVSPSPFGRMAPDGAGGVLLFNGVETWRWEGLLNRWTQLSPAVSPDGGGWLALDPATNHPVLYTGWSTWQWDAAAVTWTELATLGRPPQDWQGGAMAADRARGTIVFLGLRYSTGSTETWSWSGAERTWTQLRPSLQPPPDQVQNRLAYDAGSRRLVLFTSGNQTWTWDGLTWRQMQPAHRPPAAAAMKTGPDGRAVVFDTRSMWRWNQNDWLQDRPALSPGPTTGPYGWAFAIETDLATDAIVVLRMGWDQGVSVDLEGPWVSVQPPERLPWLDCVHWSIFFYFYIEIDERCMPQITLYLSSPWCPNGSRVCFDYRPHFQTWRYDT